MGDTPGVDAVTELDFTSIVVVGVEGVCCIEMYLYPPTRLPAMRCAGIAHRPGWVNSGRRLLEDTRGIVSLTTMVERRYQGREDSCDTWEISWSQW